MNSKYEVIRQFVAAHGGRVELIEHETAIEDSYHTLAIDPRLVVECNAIAVAPWNSWASSCKTGCASALI